MSTPPPVYRGSDLHVAPRADVGSHGWTVVNVDMYPVGPWIFWICLSALALTTVLAIVLRRRARS